ncbi:AAA family ATPase [Pseudokineococcus sp. 1T1Z-3]|uniref:AAA family ATPase n=1 Tax=Pseudokineococcus sp. 1T1Z-3 TaxID=3132745 RepID=UPI0030B1FD42
MPDDVQHVVLGALFGDDGLAQALDAPADEGAARGVKAAAEPVGAYLSRITARAFRGVGERRSLKLKPGPGLTVVAGRNGSGKSSFAEAVEVALTGANLRWSGRAVQGAKWQEGLRNLHCADDPQVEVELLVEGEARGTTVVQRTWAEGAGAEEGVAVVRHAGQPTQELSCLGWDDALRTFRPFLSYNELGDLLTGRPSELHDALASILGLEVITDARTRLADARKAMGARARDVRSAAVDLRRRALGVQDERASSAAALLQPKSPDLAAVRALIAGTEQSDESVQRRLEVLCHLAPPDLGKVDGVATELRAADAAVESLAGTDAARSAALADLLTTALAHVAEHGDERCPVCGQASLDDAWRTDTEAAVSRLTGEAEAVRKAQRRRQIALREARSLVVDPPAVLRQAPDLGLEHLHAALAAWTALVLAPHDAVGLADHLEATAVDLGDAVGTLTAEAADLLARREDVWRPLALALAAWLPGAEDVAAEAEHLRLVTAAETWLKKSEAALREERLAPLAQEAAQIWEALRQESNVQLGAVALTGSASMRRVRLGVEVDGAEASSALAVMSQGELHALALSLFLPRATVPGSPFRFIVIDDPVQAMDPAKVDGLARVLARVAGQRQVVVFTHDDRLPEALRRLQLPAEVLQVERRAGSAVTVRRVDDHADRYLSDAQCLMREARVVTEVRRRVVPGLCRLAIDAACVDAVRRTRLAAGARHVDVEALLAEQPKLYPRLALALFDDVDRTGDVRSRANGLVRGGADAVTLSNKGAHDGIGDGALENLVRASTGLVEALRR